MCGGLILPTFFIGQALRETEVDYLEVALSVQEEVLGLQVAVCDALSVDVLESKDDVGRVEAHG